MTRTIALPGTRALGRETTRPPAPHHSSPVGAAAVFLLALSALSPGVAEAHGSVSDPPSRAYSCRFLEPKNEMCALAWDANPQALYDWMEINILDADGRHRELIPDGELCSAGREKYEALDTPSLTWPTKTLVKNARGLYEFEYEATAPHATEYFRFYLTKHGFSPDRPLQWNDLELVYDTGPLPPEMNLLVKSPLPTRAGRHMLYQIWQRSDSPEAFYSCSDVMFGEIDSDLIPVDPLSSNIAPWNPSSAYYRGDVVEYEGDRYRAERWSLGSVPISEESSLAWEPLTPEMP